MKTSATDQEKLQERIRLRMEAMAQKDVPQAERSLFMQNLVYAVIYGLADKRTGK